MKKKLLLLASLISMNLIAQNIPCDFSWNSAPTTNGTKDFVTEAKSQPYQGPCLSFAFNAAIETTYGIENNVSGNSLFSLSEAYLDYKVWSATNYLSILNSTFKIPLTTSNSAINSFAPISCPVNNPDPSGCSIPRSQVLAYINHSSGQKSYNISLNIDVTPPVWQVTDGGALGNYVTVGNAYQLDNNALNTDEDIKQKILDDGPIVLKVSGSQSGIHNATKFRNYTIPAGGLSYHAFTIIGWTNDNRWVIKDSWPGMATIGTTKPNIDIKSLLNSGSVELYQVSNISYNGSSPASNPISLAVSDCQPIVNLQLSSINLEIDHVYIGGYLYHKFWVSSNTSVDNWVWGIGYPNGARKRSQINGSTTSSILMTPTTSGNVTIYVRASKNGQTVTKERNIYLSNGQSTGGGGNGGGEGW
ncbi:conserved exported protein of unknown function [Tenacibaculum sp. 190130A14a]|uniref:Peptidase C1A papain C-terminal domain-containing protein n=1 Tax=Tenacibaculum polynesiense TaxID=3137857 RepID=A0ABM9PCU1_9FLAO